MYLNKNHLGKISLYDIQASPKNGKRSESLELQIVAGIPMYSAISSLFLLTWCDRDSMQLYKQRWFKLLSAAQEPSWWMPDPTHQTTAVWWHGDKMQNFSSVQTDHPFCIASFSLNNLQRLKHFFFFFSELRNIHSLILTLAKVIYSI